MKPQRLATALSLTLGVAGTLALLWLLGRAVCRLLPPDLCTT